MTDDIVKLNLHMTKELIEAVPEDDYEVIERVQDGEPLRLYRLKPLVAQFMRDENGVPMTKTAAMKLLGKIPVGKWSDVAKQFVEALTGTAVPLETGSNSPLPSTPPLQPSESPDGSQI